VDQLPLHLSIAFFGSQVVAWAGLCTYLYFKRRRAADDALASALAEIQTIPETAQAA
jgi:hypothetical protein